MSFKIQKKEFMQPIDINSREKNPITNLNKKQTNTNKSNIRNTCVIDINSLPTNFTNKNNDELSLNKESYMKEKLYELELKEKKFKMENYLNRKKFDYPYMDREKDKKTLLQFDNTDNNFKKRKIKIGDSYNINFNLYLKNREDEQILEEDDYCQPSLVYTPNSGLTKEEVDDYIRKAMFFWEIKNVSLENELCIDFINYFKDVCEKQNDSVITNFATEKVDQILGFLKYGKTLENQFEEMALKILNLTNYSVKKALYLLYKNINPYYEEALECFKSDVNFLQRDALVSLEEFDYEEK